ncbi:MAG: cobalamin biosynthesis protein CobQ [Candidatus Levybacteria bacterium]|nr:cobalamin biosynthesis protein CobQ [Candidatus Levybacteria bacterium]
MKDLSITVGWLYPDLMSTYGDRGNIICIKKRCSWRTIDLRVEPITAETTIKKLEAIDILFGGGAQDMEQEIVMNDLRGKKSTIIRKQIEKNMPALFVCGSPQLMGNYYEPAEGKRIEGLGIFDMISKHPGKNAKRLIGNIIAEVQWENLTDRHPEPRFNRGNRSEGSNQIDSSPLAQNDSLIVGFENHGGRTYLGTNVKPFAKVVKGYGNNGEDETEGVVYKNAIGSYFHGPLLPKNPHIADWIIQSALSQKYQEDIPLTPLDDTLEWRAHRFIANRMGVEL